MRGRFLLGLSNANRQAAGVVTGDEVEVMLEFDPDPRVVVEPADFARALDANPIARSQRPPARRSQTGARARYREHEEAGDAHTADREARSNAAGPGVGNWPGGPRQDSVAEIGWTPDLGGCAPRDRGWPEAMRSPAIAVQQRYDHLGPSSGL
jgi:hypothetical protein